MNMEMRSLSEMHPVRMLLVPISEGRGARIEMIWGVIWRVPHDRWFLQDE